MEDLPRNPWVRIICFGKDICNGVKGRCQALSQTTHPLSWSAFLRAASRGQERNLQRRILHAGFEQASRAECRRPQLLPFRLAQDEPQGPPRVYWPRHTQNHREPSIYGKQAAVLRTSGEYSHFTLLDSEQLDLGGTFPFTINFGD